ncbi:MAG: DNA topoisomerase, partial [Alteraurantiacibacter sp.]|nr:DNA topoisomerase [Alteraurantiacibacter sp.]
TLRDPAGRHELRATGQVVKFPGFIAVYQEGIDQKSEDDGEDDGTLLPVMRKGDCPALKRVDAEQHFTQPPPRYSEASLVKRLEELGIGRPSTYASTIQTLRDRAYVRMEKNRFVPEESGRLLTAFLERFFPRYVAYDFTAGLEDELDEVSGGRVKWKQVLEAFWRDFKPSSDAVMERKPSEVTEALDAFLSDYLFPPKADGSDPRACPKCLAEGRSGGRLGLRSGRFGAFIACANYPECAFRRRFGQPTDDEVTDEENLGRDPETGLSVKRKTGRFGPYVQLGEGKDAKRASIPKDIPDFDLDWALKLLSLPRIIGNHPVTGLPIEANIGRYGPYLRHDGKYARLSGTRDVFETGMNAAVTLLAEASGRASGARSGGKAEPLKVLGKHPVSGGEMKVMAGRYGPYVTDGTINATIPKDMNPEDLSEEQAAALITARAQAVPAKKAVRKTAARKPAAKKPAKGKSAAKA